MGGRKEFNWGDCEMAIQKGQCQRQTPEALSKIAKLMLWCTSIVAVISLVVHIKKIPMIKSAIAITIGTG